MTGLSADAIAGSVATLISAALASAATIANFIYFLPTKDRPTWPACIPLLVAFFEDAIPGTYYTSIPNRQAGTGTSFDAGAETLSRRIGPSDLPSGSPPATQL